MTKRIKVKEPDAEYCLVGYTLEGSNLTYWCTQHEWKLYESKAALIEKGITQEELDTLLETFQQVLLEY